MGIRGFCFRDNTAERRASSGLGVMDVWLGVIDVWWDGVPLGVGTRCRL